MSIKLLSWVTTITVASFFKSSNINLTLCLFSSSNSEVGSSKTYMGEYLFKVLRFLGNFFNY